MKNPFDNYRGLWYVLAAAFMIFLILSAIGPFTMFDHEFKSSKIWPTLTAQAKKPGTGRSASASTKAGETKTAKPVRKAVATDTVPKTILFFGDSMLDGLYPRLAAYAAENGHTLYVVIWYSSTSEVWGKSDKLQKYIRDLKPDYIFVSLGSNELIIKDIAEKRDKYVKKILADIGNIPYVWIGPPNWKPDTGINDLVLENAGPDHYFVTNGMQFKRKKDGAHPTHEASIDWMDSVARWMPKHAAHPIKMRTPQQKTARAKRVFVHQPSEK